MYKLNLSSHSFSLEGGSLFMYKLNPFISEFFPNFTFSLGH